MWTSKSNRLIDRCKTNRRVDPGKALKSLGVRKPVFPSGSVFLPIGSVDRSAAGCIERRRKEDMKLEAGSTTSRLTLWKVITFVGQIFPFFLSESIVSFCQKN